MPAHPLTRNQVKVVLKPVLMTIGLICSPLSLAFGMIQLDDSDLEHYPPAIQETLKSGLAFFNQEEFFKAFQELEPLAKQGISEAQILLGAIYSHGKGVPKDFQQAYQWFLQSAKQGQPTAQYLAGMFLFNGTAGKGQIRCTILEHLAHLRAKGADNCVEAYAWFNLADSQEVKESRKMLKETARVLTRSQIIQAQELSTKYFSNINK